MSQLIPAFLAATVRTATPLALAAIGELLVERAGLINVGLEGAILAGAFGSLVGATLGGVPAGYAGAVVAGMLVAAMFATFVLWLRADQIITGTALTLLSVGVTGTLYRVLYGTSGAALSVQTSAPVVIPGLSRIPWIGTAFFAQPPITYFLYLVIGSVAWTHDSAFRIVGETVNGGSGVALGYEADDLLVQAGDLTLTRDPESGRLTGTTAGVVTDAISGRVVTKV